MMGDKEPSWTALLTRFSMLGSAAFRDASFYSVRIDSEVQKSFHSGFAM